MANKREFKKSVEALSSALLDEMMASYYNVKEADREKISQAIAKVAEAMGNAKKESSKLFNKGVKDFENMSAYNAAKAQHTKEKYRNAIASYNNALSEALKAYNEGMPANGPAQQEPAKS
ncbi:MAG: hypothetical protein J1E97_01495 [Muribaculaceae bacterium]|nr:hypothetical protein [Muribaculaceae bacterium]